MRRSCSYSRFPKKAFRPILSLNTSVTFPKTYPFLSFESTHLYLWYGFYHHFMKAMALTLPFILIKANEEQFMTISYKLIDTTH